MNRVPFILVVLLAAAAGIGQDIPPQPTVAGQNWPDDVFKAKGLAHQGFLLILAQEADVHKAALGLRGDKGKIAAELRAGKDLDEQIATLNNQIDAANAQLEKMDVQRTALLDKINHMPKNESRNPFIDQYNALLTQMKQGVALVEQAQKRLDTMQQHRTQTVDSRSTFADAAMQASDDAEAIASQYADLANDPDLLAAIFQTNQANGTHVRLGPSGNFSDDLSFIRQCRSVLPSDTVAVTTEDLTPHLDVIFNGKVHCNMIWDSGASLVSLNYKVADQIGLHPTDKDPQVEGTIANGQKVKSWLMTVPSIRVGAFTVKNVPCVVGPPSDTDAPNLLGGSFQGNFVCHLDDIRGQLRLTPITDNVTTDAPPAAAPQAGVPAPPPHARIFADLQPGLVGVLFSDSNFAQPVKARVDRQIYFDWNNDGPDPSMSGGSFSIRWTGILNAPSSGNYTLEATVDDNIHIWIDGNSVLAKTGPTRSEVDFVQAPVNLTAGPHGIRIEYQNVASVGRVMIRWSLAGDGGFPMRQFQRDTLWHDPAVAVGAEPTPAGWRSDLLGTMRDGKPFHEDAPPGCVLVGFDVGSDPRGRIASLTAIYRGPSGDVPGEQFGKAAGPLTHLIARPGYAVGTIEIPGKNLLGGITLHFVAFDGKTTNQTDSYDSDYAGVPNGRGHGITIGENKPITGIYGGVGKTLTIIGLISAD